jgi:hypothetical protein
MEQTLNKYFVEVSVERAYWAYFAGYMNMVPGRHLLCNASPKRRIGG